MGELADWLVQNDQNFRKARLPALYSDFRPQRTLNPDGYNANLTAWRQALSRLTNAGLLPSSSPFILQTDTSLLRSLENRQFGQPLALGTAVRDAIGQKELFPYQEFLKSTQKIGQQGWGEVPWAIAGWALRQVGIGGASKGEDKLPTGKYIVMENLETAGRKFNEEMAARSTRFERIWSKTQFQSEFGTELVPKQRLSDNDLNILLTFLSRDKEVIMYDGKTIRYKGTGDQGPITEQDATIASIKELTATLKHQISLLETRIDELQETAKSAITRKNRISALASLKSKKLAEASLTTRYATLNQLEEVASKIEQASDQVQLVKVMESSTEVLSGLNKEVGGADRVDGVMDQLRERMGETDEVNAILSEGMTTVDEVEIDDELQALEAEERNKEEEKERKVKEVQEEKAAEEARKKLAEMPDVPQEEAQRKERLQTPTTETGIGNLSLA